MIRVRPRSNSSEHALLVKGSKVVIIETENTLHRLPQYIGQIGIIKEAPGDISQNVIYHKKNMQFHVVF
jgi:hypothetical protein